MEQDLAPFNEGPENGPDQRVIALVNSYIVHTTGLLNNYAAWSEVELVNIHERCSSNMQTAEAVLSPAETFCWDDVSKSDSPSYAGFLSWTPPCVCLRRKYWVPKCRKQQMQGIKVT